MGKAKKKNENIKIKNVKKKKYKCATTGKHECSRCGAGISRGDIVRTVSVDYSDGMRDVYDFCSKECRDDYCRELSVKLKD